MLRVETVAKPRHTGCDLVELYTLFASICSGAESLVPNAMQAGGKNNAELESIEIFHASGFVKILKALYTYLSCRQTS